MEISLGGMSIFENIEKYDVMKNMGHSQGNKEKDKNK